MKHFHNFKTDISTIKLPKKFTFPFYYEPHSLSLIAVKELHEYLENQTDFQHNFGLNEKDKNLAIGKMFGVLVVQNQNNEIGYLAAFSGKFNDNSLPKMFVPPVFNMRTEGSFYTKGENELNSINKQIGELENNPTYLEEKKNLDKVSKSAFENLAKEKEKLKARKKKRKSIKKNTDTNSENYSLLIKKLKQESFNDQFYLKELTKYLETKINNQLEKTKPFSEQLEKLKKERKKKSNYLQETLFENYQFLNQQGELKSLNSIFNNPEIKPPAGSGECSAPKLLQYAFSNNLKPIAMAEFWWGKSPNSEIRKHKNFYPACQGRCKPILSHMLSGIEMDENPMLENSSAEKEIEIIFEDDTIIVINKPAELLSVPGKEINDSVYTRIKILYPKATGPLLVHRLDMSTSGIMVFTKTKEANKILQNQFIKRTVKKRYVALLDGITTKNKGEINLPLRVDLDDRPRQLVCYEHGKRAVTKWEVIEQNKNTTRVHFYPITGRTHQLRVHASHPKGLNTPIIGDDLYGKKSNRLHLHAEHIEFTHPISKEVVSFTVKADF